MQERFELEAVRLAAGGDGVGHKSGKVVLARGLLPGERGFVEVREDRLRVTFAELSELTVASPERRPLDCLQETEEGCGGCGFRHVIDSASLSLKASATVAELRKLGRGLNWPGVVLHPLARLDQVRTRVRLHGDWRGFGLFRRRSHEVVRLPDCRALQPELLAGVLALEEAVLRSPGELPPKTVVAERFGDHLWASWAGAAGPRQRCILGELVESGRFRGIRFGRGRSEILGQDWMEEVQTVGGRRIVQRRRIGSFAQGCSAANTVVRERLHELLLDLAPERALDLYAGSGNLTLAAGLVARETVGVESDPDGVDSILESAAASGLNGVSSVRADLHSGIPAGLVAERWEAVVLDPPRTGALEVLSDLVSAGPATILYVSCAAGPLARDAARLSEAYEVVGLEAFDMFPRTPHIELLAVFRRR